MVARSDNRVVDTLAAIERAPSVLKVKEAFRQFAECYGFTTFMCADPPLAETNDAGSILFDEWPPAWRRRYLQRKYVYRDPMVLEIHRTEHPFLWADVLERRQYARRDQAIVFEAAEWGMRVGFVVPMHLTGGRVHTMTMAGASPRTDLQARAELHLISMYAHARAMRLRQDDPEEPLRLTKREREVLQLVSTGKSDWEIGVILNISASAVHKHVENVKHRLDVSTRVQAVVAAIRSGEIAL